MYELDFCEASDTFIKGLEDHQTYEACSWVFVLPQSGYYKHIWKHHPAIYASQLYSNQAIELSVLRNCFDLNTAAKDRKMKDGFCCVFRAINSLTGSNKKLKNLTYQSDIIKGLRMGKINDIDLAKWRESDVWTDSLWIIDERDKSGKHDGFYHGNFVPQVPRQLIKKYTKKGDVVLDLFLGSGTTAFEAETLKRNFIGVDIVPEMVAYTKEKLDDHKDYFYEVIEGDSSSKEIKEKVQELLEVNHKSTAQLVILHPPYANIIKFSDNRNDLSNATCLSDFIKMFSKVLKNASELLENGRYLAIVIGDIYKNSEWVPLGFYCMDAAQKQSFKLKSIVVKNMSGNRGKRNQEGIWTYRSLANDYYVFKHEYVLIHQ